VITLQRAVYPQQIVPVVDDPAIADLALEQRPRVAVGGPGVEPREPLVARSRMWGANGMPGRSNRAKTSLRRSFHQLTRSVRRRERIPDVAMMLLAPTTVAIVWLGW
jgi:hypothetical protein